MKIKLSELRYIIKEEMQKMNERKFDINWGSMGNGISVWNSAKEVHGDYEKVAHIDRNRKITWYVKNLPTDVKDQVEKIAKGKNPSISASQSYMKAFNEGAVESFPKNIIKKIEDMTDNNNHTEAYLTIAKVMKNEKLINGFTKILSKQNRLGHLPYELSIERSKLYQDMMKIVKSRYTNGNDVYKAT